MAPLCHNDRRYFFGVFLRFRARLGGFLPVNAHVALCRNPIRGEKVKGKGEGGRLCWNGKVKVKAKDCTRKVREV